MFPITNKEFSQLATYIKLNYGIHLNEEKKILVAGRLSQVLQQLQIHNFSDYLEYVRADRSGQAVTTLINRITTNHTFFMRESNHFQFLSENVFPSLLPTIKDHDLRVWSAGCSTGEEAYTLAMLIDEYLGQKKKSWDSKVLATDISEQVLGVARKGVYDNEALASLSKSRRLSYFTSAGDQQAEVVDRIKNEVIFRRFNLMDPVFPFKRKFHVIFCRNVMIYFDHKTKMDLIQKFYKWLEPKGYLFIGHSETIVRDYTKLRYVMPAVYRKD